MEGDNHLIKNNVVHDVGYSIAAIGDGIKVIEGTGTDVLNNTVYNTGQRGISFAGLEAGEIKYNDVFEASKQRLDVAGIESFRGGDGKGTEVAYNQIHDITPYYDPESGHLGGQGIRLDPGGEPEGISNYKIHHNLIWDTSHLQSIEVWSLNPNMNNYGNSNITIFNNTVDGGVRLFGHQGSSHKGTIVKNNITLGAVNYGGASNRDGLFDNNLDSQDNPRLVDPNNDDFRLQSSSAAIDAAKPLAGVQYSVPDGQPDMGALEYGQPPFNPGADDAITGMNGSATASIVVEGDSLATAAISNTSETDNEQHEIMVLDGDAVDYESTASSGILTGGTTISKEITELDDLIGGNQVSSLSLDSSSFNLA